MYEGDLYMLGSSGDNVRLFFYCTVRSYCTVRQCLVNCEPEDKRLAIVLPGVKKTEVGVALSLVWIGEVFPLLLVDVDVVATVRVSWPPALRRPKLMPSTFDSV